MKQLIYWILTTGIILTSCLKEKDAMIQDKSMAISVEIADQEVFPDDCKSSYTDAELNKISDLNILVYHSGALMTKYSRYFNPANNLSLDLPANKDGFNIYILGNVGNIVNSAPSSESQMQKFEHTAASYMDFHSKGFPLAGKITDFKKGNTAHFKVKRLAGQYHLQIITNATDAEYTIKQVKLKNCALDVYPFMDMTNPIKACRFVGQQIETPGDYLSPEDITKLNRGEAVDLYFLENLQGTLLPGNTDPKKKIPSGISPSEVANHCTYLEIIADIKTPAGIYTNGKFHYYLGADATTNFDIHRNRRYNLIVRMSQDMVTEDGWRIEVAPPAVSGKFVTDKDVANVIQNVEDMIFIDSESGNHANLDYIVEYAQSGIFKDDTGKEYTEMSTLPQSAINFQVRTEKVKDLTKTGIAITSNMPISGAQPLGVSQIPCGTVILAIKSVDKYNGTPILVKYVKVKVYDKAWPIVFKKNPADNKLYVYIDNPLNLNFMVGVQYTMASDQKDGFYYKVYSNTRYKDTNGKWIRPLNNSFVSNQYGLKYISFAKADWSKFNLVDVRANITDLRVLIEPLHTLLLTEGGGFSCVEDGLTHQLAASCSRYEPYPHFINAKSLTDITRPDPQIGPRGAAVDGQIPVGIPNCADNTWICTMGHTSGSYIVNPDGKFRNGFYQIRDVVFRNGNADSKIFSYVNDNSPLTTGESPFYIANGIATIFKVNVNNDEPTSIGDKNATLRGFYVELHGPGRDLDATPAPAHSAEYFTKNLKQIGGNIHRWFLTKGYYYSGTYMTINDCISWPHGSRDANGVTIPSHLTF